MRASLRWEIYRLFKRRRAYLGLSALVLVPALIAYALSQAGGFSPGRGDAPTLAGELLNGYYVSVIGLLLAMPLFIPAVVVMVAGDIVSGEHSDGTLRMLLLRPVPRTTVILAKVIASAMYGALSLVALGLAGVISGGLAFGWGPVISLNGTPLSHAEAALSLGLAYAVACVLVMAVASVALFLSVAGRNSPAAIGGALGLVVVFQILGAFDTFDPIAPYLFTSYFDSWLNLFRSPVHWPPIWKGAATAAAYVVPLLAGAVGLFRRQDILT